MANKIRISLLQRRLPSEGLYDPDRQPREQHVVGWLEGDLQDPAGELCGGCRAPGGDR